MESEALVKVVTWPAWILLFCSVAVLLAGFARAFAEEFRRFLPSGGEKPQDDERRPTPS
jgi:hypothetical protein